MQYARPVLAVASWALGALVVYRFVDPAALQLYLVITAFVLILTNLSHRTHGMSAYSVFNRNFEPLMGQLQPEQFENEMRHRPIDHTPTRHRDRSYPRREEVSLLEATRREIQHEQRRASRTSRVEERPRRRR